MGNAIHSPTTQVPNRNDAASLGRFVPSTQTSNFESRWNVFLNSLDISSDQAKHVDTLEEDKKLELLAKFEAKKSHSSIQHPVSYYISILNNLDWNRLLNAKKKEDTGCTLRTLLSSTEISLRTNSVQWVYDFLNCDGLEILSSFMSSCLHILSYPEDTVNGPATEPSFKTTPTVISCALDSSVLLEPAPKSVQTEVRNLLKDCLHLSLRCLKTVLNNQQGCKRAFEKPEILKVITFCLLHPNFGTKALTLELLTALCLIEGGHIRVLQAFDCLRQVLGEGLRFELLLHAFEQHERFGEAQYNIDFSVACVQFFNIIVHSPEHLNLRVYLQYELFLLGLDDTLKNLCDHAGDRLRQHVEAYLENRVDCSVLLEDAEAKEAAVAELERVESEIAARVQAAEIAARDQAEANFKSRELELSQLVESLRSRIRDMNLGSLDRENELRRQVHQLKHSLKTYHNELNKMRIALEQSSVESSKPTACMATSTNFDSGIGSPNEVTTTLCEELGGQSDSDAHSQTPLEDRYTDVGQIHALSDSIKSECRSQSFSGPQKPARKSAGVEKSIPSNLTHLTDPSSIRRLASEAACTLSQLVSNLSVFLVTSSAGWSVPPIGWDPHLHRDSCVRNESCLKNALSSHPLNLNCEPPYSGTILEQAVKLHCDRMAGDNDPWANALTQCENAFPSDPFNQDPLDWLAALDLIPSPTSSHGPTAATSWNLTNNLLELRLDCLVARRLVNQLSNTTNTHGLSNMQSVLDALESALAHHFQSIFPDPNWRPNGREPGVHWFWTISLLRLNLLRYQWPVELQHIAEAVSTLLAGCTDVLTNSKLPIILGLISIFTNRITANWNNAGSPLQCLDSLIDWQLIGPVTTAPPTAAGVLRPPVNGGPPDYQSSTNGSEQTVTNPNSSQQTGRITFVQAFADLLARVAPNLIDWSTELEHLGAASRVSLTYIYEKLSSIEHLCNIWESINSAGSFHTECTQSLSSIHVHLKHLRQVTDIVRTVASATSHWMGFKFDDNQEPCWLTSLARFHDAFKHYSLCERDRKPSPNKPDCSQSNGRQKRQKHAKAQHRPGGDGRGGKREHRHHRRSTRPLDSDGVMDDILAGLTSQPLRADVHTRRKETKSFRVIE